MYPFFCPLVYFRLISGICGVYFSQSHYIFHLSGKLVGKVTALPNVTLEPSCDPAYFRFSINERNGGKTSKDFKINNTGYITFYNGDRDKKGKIDIKFQSDEFLS